MQSEAIHGNKDEQFNLGLMYEEGRGVPQDYSEAIYWYMKAAYQGHARAQYNLGVMYQNRIGVNRHYSEAAKWYMKAADQGDARAQNNLGWLYEMGRGVPQDYSEAIKWYKKAADQGYTKAQYNLGLMYQNGRGVPQNYSEAVKWYMKAADQGDAPAHNDLGVMYHHGRGVPQDYSEVVNGDMNAADQGNSEARNNPISIENRLNGIQAISCDKSIVSKTIENQNNDKISFKTNAFASIFDVIPHESFENNPRIILSYMMDYGFSRVQIRLLDTVLSFDSKRFIDLLSCSDEEIDSNTRLIADYCLIDYATLKDLVVEIRLAIKSMNSQSQFSHST